MILLIFALQVGLVFWLGARSMPAPRNAAPALVMQLSGYSSNELFALSDPTVFALPHRQNFSGPAWLKTPELTFHPSDWTESPRPLLLDVSALGATFQRFMLTNSPRTTEIVLPSVPETFSPEPTLLQPLAKPAALRIQGNLASQRLLTPIDLPPQTNSDLLPATEVQVVVNAHGNVLSAVTLRSSGKADADQYALEQAKRARFEPLQRTDGTPSDAVSIGTLLFDWQTVPLPATNGAPASISQ